MNATRQMFQGIDPQETLALARLACDVGDEAPHRPVYTACWTCSTRAKLYEPGADGRPSRFAPGIHLIAQAAALARTPDVPLPRPGRLPGQGAGTAVR